MKSKDDVITVNPPQTPAACQNSFSIPIDKRPSIREYALLSKHIYLGNELIPGQKVPDTSLIVCRIFSGDFGYLSALYINERTHQLVLVHRGTSNFKGLVTDLAGIINNHISHQQCQAYNRTQEAILTAKKLQLQLSFTGHSLGAWLAEQSLFFAKTQFDYPDCNAVTFESPGSHEMLSTHLQSNLPVNKIELNKLDLVECLSHPNLINTFKEHSGTVLHIKPDMPQHHTHFVRYTLEAHSIESICEALQAASPLFLVNDWPYGHKQGRSAIEASNDLCSTHDPRFFNHERASHFQIDLSRDPRFELPLRHFNSRLALLLSKIDELYQPACCSEPKKDLLRTQWSELNIPAKAISLLLNFTIKQQWIKVNDQSYTIDQFRRILSTELSQFPTAISHLLQQHQPEMLCL